MHIPITVIALATIGWVRGGFVNQVSSYASQQHIPGGSAYQSYETVGLPLELQAYAASSPVVIPTKSQYHAQDENGQAAYGHSELLQAHNAVQDAAGNKAGAYSYINPMGQLINTQYIADNQGVRVTGNALPIAPQGIQETPEVLAARAAHLEAVHNLQLRNRREFVPFNPLYGTTGTAIVNTPGHAVSYRLDSYPHQHIALPQFPSFEAAPVPHLIATQPAFINHHPTFIQPINQIPNLIGDGLPPSRPPPFVVPVTAGDSGVSSGGGPIPEGLAMDAGSDSTTFDSDTVAIEAARSSDSRTAAPVNGGAAAPRSQLTEVIARAQTPSNDSPADTVRTQQAFYSPPQPILRSFYGSPDFMKQQAAFLNQHAPRQYD